MSQENKKLLEHAAHALRSFGASPSQVGLRREFSIELTPPEAALALQNLAAQANDRCPLVGWWQMPEYVAHTAQSEPTPLPDAAKMNLLLEGEWTCGNTTLQLRRHGNGLRQSRLTELSPDAQAPAPGGASGDIQPALAQTHALLGRADLHLGTITVVVYSIWDAQRQQVVPVAQRLRSFGND